MTEEIVLLDLTQGEDEKTKPPRVRLAVRAYPSDSNGLISLTPECNTQENFEQAVEKLRGRLESLVVNAREAFHQYDIQVGKEKGSQVPHTVEGIWQFLEDCDSTEQMQETFNNLDLNTRKRVANFVLTQLNIFKGAASTFSQHYDEEECLLE